MAGPLAGLKVIEIAGQGPGPFAAMTLADLGADVVRVDRPHADDLFSRDPGHDLLNRGKRSVILDLKRPQAVSAALALVERADVLIEGYRPRTLERLGLGPDVCLERNSRLIYGRVTGWGQTGPLAMTAGHDIDYIALNGLLHAVGDRGGPPQIPLNVAGDLGGGGVYLVIGILAALREVERSGRGQVIDAAIVDGSAHLLASVHAMLAMKDWREQRGTNLFDGGAPFYAVYETSDRRYMAVGAVEAKFYARLVEALGIEADVERQYERESWPVLEKQFADMFRTRTQAEWTELFESIDACVAPVLGLREAVKHPHIQARGTIVSHRGMLQSAPAPRFSVTQTRLADGPPSPGQHTREVLSDWGVPGVQALIDSEAARERR